MAEVKIIDAGELADLSSNEDDDEKMDGVDLVPEIDMPAFRAQAFPGPFLEAGYSKFIFLGRRIEKSVL